MFGPNGPLFEPGEQPGRRGGTLAAAHPPRLWPMREKSPARSSSQTQRNPISSFRSIRWFLLRFETRRFLGLLFQPPPRSSGHPPLCRTNPANICSRRRHVSPKLACPSQDRIRSRTSPQPTAPCWNSRCIPRSLRRKAVTLRRASRVRPGNKRHPSPTFAFLNDKKHSTWLRSHKIRGKASLQHESVLHERYACI